MEAHILQHRDSKSKKQGHRDSKSKNHEIEIPRPKNHDIKKQRQISHDIVISRRFFRGQKATTSRFQDYKATTSSSCGILTFMPPDKKDTASSFRGILDPYAPRYYQIQQIITSK